MNVIRVSVMSCHGIGYLTRNSCDEWNESMWWGFCGSRCLVWLCAGVLRYMSVANWKFDKSSPHQYHNRGFRIRQFQRKMGQNHSFIHPPLKSEATNRKTKQSLNTNLCNPKWKTKQTNHDCVIHFPAYQITAWTTLSATRSACTQIFVMKAGTVKFNWEKKRKKNIRMNNQRKKKCVRQLQYGTWCTATCSASSTIYHPITDDQNVTLF